MQFRKEVKKNMGMYTGLRFKGVVKNTDKFVEDMANGKYTKYQ